MPTLRLRNLQRSLRDYELPIALDGGQPHAVGQVDRGSTVDRAQVPGVRLVTKRLPTTLTLAARDTVGDTSEPLDEAVLGAPAIAAAVAKGQLEVLRTPVAAPAPAAPPPPVTPDPATPEEP